MHEPVCHRRLRRFWFPLTPGFGIGVTATSEDEARAEAAATKERYGMAGELGIVIPDIDVSTLDAKHVLPNIGPPVVRGVWYPALNL